MSVPYCSDGGAGKGVARQSAVNNAAGRLPRRHPRAPWPGRAARQRRSGRARFSLRWASLEIRYRLGYTSGTLPADRPARRTTVTPSPDGTARVSKTSFSPVSRSSMPSKMRWTVCCARSGSAMATTKTGLLFPGRTKKPTPPWSSNPWVRTSAGTVGSNPSVPPKAAASWRRIAWPSRAWPPLSDGSPLLPRACRAGPPPSHRKGWRSRVRSGGRSRAVSRRLLAAARRRRRRSQPQADRILCAGAWRPLPDGGAYFALGADRDQARAAWPESRCGNEAFLNVLRNPAIVISSCSSGLRGAWLFPRSRL